MKKVIVSGANGFIGTALCRELAKEDVEIIAIVRNEQENITEIKDIPRLKVIYCDLSDFKNLELYVHDRDIDVFYHLAWVGSAGPMRGDCDVQMNNIQYTCDTVRACAKLECKRFVFASSIMEYEVEMIMQTSSTPGINTLYSSAKIAANHMARTLAGSLDIDYIRAVISNIYGPGETSPRLINTSLRKLLSGEHCAFSEGTQMYDFIYITDAVKSFIAIAENGIANKAYYIGSGAPKPLKDFLIEMRDQIDPTIQIGLGEIAFSGISLSYNEFDIHAIEKDTGFVPQMSFAEGIRRTAEWIRKNVC